MFERFSERAKRVLVLAAEEARLLGSADLTGEHIVLAILLEGDDVAAAALDVLGVTADNARPVVEQHRAEPLPAGVAVPFSGDAKGTLTAALREALELGHRSIEPEHLLLGLLRFGDGRGIELLRALDVEPATLHAQIIQMLPET